jgi:hypothetical protein
MAKIVVSSSMAEDIERVGKNTRYHQSMLGIIRSFEDTRQSLVGFVYKMPDSVFTPAPR